MKTQTWGRGMNGLANWRGVTLSMARDDLVEVASQLLHVRTDFPEIVAGFNPELLSDFSESDGISQSRVGFCEVRSDYRKSLEIRFGCPYLPGRICVSCQIWLRDLLSRQIPHSNVEDYGTCVQVMHPM